MSSLPSTRYFTSLNQELSRRSSSAVLGALGPVSAPLRARLREVLQAPPGEGASFLADPVFEPMFDPTPSSLTMAGLADEGLLARDLVEAMDAEPEAALREYRFPANRKPFLHQEQAWRHLRAEPPRSVLVTSGTGSGKTECFLVPILDDLARAREREGRLTGVRALFLYPLNALINSQRDRLRAWCAPFRGDLRFCLYNGETPERAGRGSTGKPEQVSDRKTLREDPPPILVTNSTMLEYLLIRGEDQRIIAPSKGKLRWIVLDEAHTYLGSHAAEMALLLRRVLHSFEVDADDVRFVATSATIGDDSPGSEELLRSFLADLAGVEPERVSVVRGHPLRPPLPDEFTARTAPLPEMEDLAALDPAARFETLASNLGVRRMRHRLLHGAAGAATLSDLTWERLGTPPGDGEARQASSAEREATARLLDLCGSARRGDASLLRLRAHLFHRTHAGLWACLNLRCPGRQGTPLDDPAWPFGRLFLDRRESCDACEAIVCGLVLCDECGAEYASAEVVPDENGRRLRPRDPTEVSDADEYRELVEAEDEEGGEAPVPESFPRLLTGSGARGTSPIQFHVRTGTVRPSEAQGEGLTSLGELFSESHDTHSMRCARCGRVERRPGELFRDTRRGGPFFLRSIIPLLLDYTPPIDANPGGVPARGRRLITFTDSRQGTARFALDAQLDAERNFTRGVVYHQLAAKRLSGAAGADGVAAAEATLQAFEVAAAADPTNAIVQNLVAESRQKLAALRQPPRGRLTWGEAADVLAHEEVVGTWMPSHWSHVPLARWSARQRAELMLLREFVRRPKRQNSLETLGLAALEYPELRGQPPAPWSMQGLEAADWRNFLKIAVDFTIRGNTAVQVDDDHLRWLGVPARRKLLQGPGAERGSPRTVPWPTVAGARPSNRLIQLLARLLRVDPDAAEIDQCLYAAWEQIRPLLSQTTSGFLLNLQERAVLQEVREAWLCPVTRRVLDTVVCGITPYVSAGMTADAARCLEIRMPLLPHPFWRSVDDAEIPREEVEAWVAGSEEIRALEAAGVWSDLSDRIVRSVTYFQAAEHSAQQSGARLRQLEAGFRAGRVNLLSCSTTMEMGVDIGGLSGVAMNNPPPSPANYRQRAGRAGRRGEARAFSLTLCKNNPHGAWIFQRPLWPFETPAHVTEVSLTSERIVQRHVNSLALTRFFALTAGGGSLPKLEAGAFFERGANTSASPCERFEQWLLAGGAADAWMRDGLQRLVRRSVLLGADPRRLLANAHEAIHAVSERWGSELEPLLRDLEGFDDAPENRAPKQAVLLRLRRMRGEYLLRELALRNFLPGYGFPTQVVPFVTTTAEDLSRTRRQEEETTDRDDDRAVSRGYPSRDVAVALRDYAPGGTVVVDGRVLEVGGLTLHWKVPVGDQVREPQALRWAWECRHCGDTGTALRQPGSCPSEECVGRQQDFRTYPYLEPSGFAVDIRHEPTNDLTRNAYLPVEQPWITGVGEPWQALPSPELGRYRYSPRGQIFTHSKGQNGAGYALCLRCGRAASETGDAAELPESMDGHRPLRGTADAGADGKTCRGNDSPGLIRRHLWLGAKKETDVFELQLRSAETGRTLRDQRAAISMAVALRQALTEHLNIEEREIGWACSRSRVAGTGEVTWSLVLYDTATGGAGFVSRAAGELPRLFVRVRDILTCQRACDGACHSCLLTYDTHHHAANLNRHAALELLTDRFLAGLQLPARVRMFGDATALEFEALPAALHRELRRAQRLRLFLGGGPDTWEPELWPLDDWLRRWSADGITTELVVPESLLPSLDLPSRGRLAAWSEAGIATVLTAPSEIPEDDAGRLIAEVGSNGGHVRFGVFTEGARSPSASWGIGTGNAYVVRIESPEPLPPPDAAARHRTGGELRGPAPGSARALTLHQELDGPVAGFGKRFWDLVLVAEASPGELLSTGAPVASIEYVDRYLVTPLAMRLLTEVLRALRARFPVACAGADVRVTTALADPNQRRKHAWIHDNWPATADRGQILAVLAEAPDAATILTELPKPQIPHARELRLAWGDGRSWLVRFDEGFGFMRSAGASPAFPFDQPEVVQAQILQGAVLSVEGRIATTLYVFGVDGSPALGH